MGTSWDVNMVQRNFNRALSMLHILNFKHKSRTDCTHSKIIHRKHQDVTNFIRQYSHQRRNRRDQHIKNPMPIFPVAILGTSKLDKLRKLIDIFQGKISPKTTLYPTETHFKVLEKGGDFVPASSKGGTVKLPIKHLHNPKQGKS